MNRRSFLKNLGLFVGGVAIEQAIPFNRVWSFPSEIKTFPNLASIYYSPAAISELKQNLIFMHSRYANRRWTLADSSQTDNLILDCFRPHNIVSDGG